MSATPHSSGVLVRRSRRALVGRQVGARGRDVVGDPGIAAVDDPERDAGRLEVLEQLGRHAGRRERPERLEVADGEERRPAGLALPGGSQHAGAILAVGRDQRRHGLGVDPRQAGREHEGRVRVGHHPDRGLDAVHDLGDRPLLRRDRIHERRLRVGERRRDGPVGIERAHDDGRGAARPGDVGEPPDAGRPVRVGEGRGWARGEDDGGDGHGLLLVCGAVYRRQASGWTGLEPFRSTRVIVR